MQQFIYRVDAQDRITFVDANWLAFAAENGLPALTAEAVTGKVLWDFISDLTSRQFYKIFAGKARETGQIIAVPFRCDGPEQRRFMKMFIVPQPEGALEFRSLLEREEARPGVGLFDANVPRNGDYISVCAWCKRAKASDWVEAEVAVQELRLFHQPRLPQISHGICPDCKKALLLLAESP
ncbi:MAG: hypothetical protein ACLQAH_10305 [Limisphaerales bacterium]